MDKQMSLSALSDELAQVRTKKKNFSHRWTASFRGESESHSFGRAIIKESVATNPTIWNECFEST